MGKNACHKICLFENMGRGPVQRLKLASSLARAGKPVFGSQKCDDSHCEKTLMKLILSLAATIMITTTIMLVAVNLGVPVACTIVISGTEAAATSSSSTLASSQPPPPPPSSSSLPSSPSSSTCSSSPWYHHDILILLPLPQPHTNAMTKWPNLRPRNHERGMMT